MSTNNSTGDPGAGTTPSAPTTSPKGNADTTSNTPTAPTTPPTSTPPTTTPTTTPPTTSSTPTAPPTTTPTTPPTTQQQTTPTTPTTPPTTPPTTNTPTTAVVTSVFTPPDGGTSTMVTTVTSTTQDATNTAGTHTTSTSSSTTGGAAIGPTGSSSSGLSSGGRIAVAVVVPIAAVALLVLAGIYFWRKRRQRKDAEEQRRKEVEDYTFNPNGDRNLAAMAASGAAGAGGYELMKEDAGSSGYRGWGTTTLAGSTGRKASTTMSGGAAGPAYSDATSPTRGGPVDARSGEAPYSDGTHSPEGEILGAMGPSAANNRGGDVRRGPSNASSSYSAAARSDGSGDAAGVAYGGADANYYNQYGNNNPYTDNPYGSPPNASELPGAPVIRDNPARRNTRIESPAHYPQQTANVSQNF